MHIKHPTLNNNSSSPVETAGVSDCVFHHCSSWMEQWRGRGGSWSGNCLLLATKQNQRWCQVAHRESQRKGGGINSPEVLRRSSGQRKKKCKSDGADISRISRTEILLGCLKSLKRTVVSVGGCGVCSLLCLHTEGGLSQQPYFILFYFILQFKYLTFTKSIVFQV